MLLSCCLKGANYQPMLPLEPLPKASIHRNPGPIMVPFD